MFFDLTEQISRIRPIFSFTWLGKLMADDRDDCNGQIKIKANEIWGDSMLCCDEFHAQNGVLALSQSFVADEAMPFLRSWA